jgi:phage shock protein PspC (stress-responsive transcriptional regulator)
LADRFYVSVYAVPIGTVIVVTLAAIQMQRKYLVAWLIMPIGHTWSKWNSVI